MIALALALVAFLYGAVGHAGATGYIAVFALAGLAPEQIRPTALLLNVVVASLGSWQFWRAGHLQWRQFWAAAPGGAGGFLGGWLDVPTRGLRVLLGVVLLSAAVRFLLRPQDPEQLAPPDRFSLLATGGGLGFMAGLTGTGGGISQPVDGVAALVRHPPSRRGISGVHLDELDRGALGFLALRPTASGCALGVVADRAAGRWRRCLRG